MAVTNYHTVNGRIRGQSTAGVRTDYLTDALGSVVATVNSSAQVVNTYRYKPYGERLAKTGAGADPRFSWVGELGYRDTSRADAEMYVRSRHYSIRQSSWTSQDLYWLTGHPTAYGRGNPVSNVDPTGYLVMLYLLIPSPKDPEAYARIRSLTTTTRVSGNITLPRYCYAPDDPSVWYTFYLAFAASSAPSSTLHDCGISFSCGKKEGRKRGWYAFSIRDKKRGGTQQKPCPECGPGRTVPVKLEIQEPGLVNCKVGNLPFPPHVNPKIGNAHVAQMAMGCNPSRRALHSIATWSDMFLGSTPWYDWNKTEVQRTGTYIFDGVDSFSPFAAHYGESESTCDCPVENPIWPPPL